MVGTCRCFGRPMVGLLVSLSLLGGWVAARNERKDAVKAFAAGQYESAYRDIITWCKKKPDDQEGHQVLQDIVPKVLAHFRRQAETAAAAGQWEEAVAHCRKLLDLAGELTMLPTLRGKGGTTVAPPAASPDLPQLLADTTRRAADALCDAADQSERAGQLQEAAGLYARAASFLPDHRNAAANTRRLGGAAKQAEAERWFQTAMDHYHRGAYRPAFHAFQKCLAEQPGFPEAEARLSECRAKGEVKVVIIPSGDNSRFRAESESFCRSVVAKAMAARNPFLTITDAGTLSGLLGGASYGRGLNDPAVLAQVDQSGVQLLVFCDIGDLSESVSPPERRYGEAFEWRMQPDSSMTSHRVNYEVVSQQSAVNLKVQFRIVDTATAQIIESAEVNRQDSDRVEYALTSANPDMLYTIPVPAPNLMSTIGAMMAGRKLDSGIFGARRDLQSSRAMLDNLLPLAADDVCQKLAQFLDQKYDRYRIGPPATTVPAAAAPPPAAAPDPQFEPAPEPARPPTPAEPAVPRAAPPSAPAKPAERVSAGCPFRLLRLDGSIAFLTGGELDGVEPGMLVELYDPAQPRTVLATGNVSDVQAHRCQVLLDAVAEALEGRKNLCVRYRK